MRGLIVGLHDWIALNQRIEILAGEIDQMDEKEANCRRLMSVRRGSADLDRRGQALLRNAAGPYIRANTGHEIILFDNLIGTSE